MVLIRKCEEQLARVPFFDRLVRSEPTLLLQDGKPIKANLAKERVDIAELEMAAREHGIAELSQVAAAVLEEDGSISIIPKEGGKVHKMPRRFRQFKNR